VMVGVMLLWFVSLMSTKAYFEREQ
jgi:hypothetical protein